MLDGPQTRPRTVWTSLLQARVFHSNKFCCFCQITYRSSLQGESDAKDHTDRHESPRRERAAESRERQAILIMLLQLTALAAVAATSPPFKTAVGLRPAARGLQDFAECPVLTKIKKDDCTDVCTSRG